MLLKCILLLHSNVFILVPFEDKLGKGFPLLNFAHTSLTGFVIKINQGHLVICTDVHYQLEGEEDIHSHC
ncbi:unnamed protein product [Coccothraustes coccothraustes]